MYVMKLRERLAYIHHLGFSEQQEVQVVDNMDHCIFCEYRIFMSNLTRISQGIMSVAHFGFALGRWNAAL